MKNVLGIWSLLLIILVGGCGREKNNETAAGGEKVAAARVQLSLSVKSVNAATNYYQKLGFIKLEARESGTDPWALLSDDKVQIMLSQNPFPSPMLTYFDKQMEQRVHRLVESGLSPEKIKNEMGKFSAAVLSDPNGIGISLVQFDPGNLPPFAANRPGSLIAFKEILLPTTFVDSTAAFWELLGFRKITDAQGQVTLSDGLLNLEVVRAKKPSPPVLTFMTGNLPEMIRQLEREKISIQTKIPGKTEQVTKIVLQTPDGQLIRIVQS